MAGINSRWKLKGPVARYDKPTQDAIDRKYREPHGWRKGAKVSKR